MYLRARPRTVRATRDASYRWHQRDPDTVASPVKIPNGEPFPEREVEIIIMHESGGLRIELLVAQQVYLYFTAFFISILVSQQSVKMTCPGMS